MYAKRGMAQEQPFIRAGIFKIRLPFLHFRLLWPEMLQAVLMVAVGFSAIPLLQETLGMPYEVALTAVAVAEFLTLFHVFLGDPVVPGWIASALPLVMAFLGHYPAGPAAVHAMMALQFLVAALFIGMGWSGMAHRLTRMVPPSLKAGILMGAGIAAIRIEFQQGGHVARFPITLTLGAVITFVILFSPKFGELKKQKPLLRSIGSYGMLPGLVISMVVGPLVGELAFPEVKWGFIDFRFSEMIANFSPWGIGLPPLSTFLSALPMAVAVYIIAFGEIITAEAVLKEAGKERPDEHIDYNTDRSNIIAGIRNATLATACPFTPMAGPLWAAISIAICERYKEGRKAIDSIHDGMGSFRIAAAFCVVLLPVATLCRPVLPVALGLTLLVQGFACAYIAIGMLRDRISAGIAGVVAAIVGTKGVGWGLGIGIVLCLLLCRSADPKPVIPGLAQEE